MSTLFNDLKYGLRQLRKHPGFTAVAVVTLALGIGANTTIFSLMNAILLRSLPVPNPHALRILTWSGGDVSLSNFTGSGWTENGRLFANAFPHATYQDFRERASGVADVFCFFPVYNQTTQTNGNVGISGALMVSGNFFSGLGGRAFIGRILTADDDRVDAEAAAVITYRLWQRRFGSDPNVLGRTIAVNRHPFTIVGVMPRHYSAPLAGDPVDVFVPMAVQPQLQPERALASYDNWWVLMMARLAPDASDAQLHALLKSSFEHTIEVSSTNAQEPDILMADGRAGIVPDRRFIAPALYALQGVVATILLIVCANLAGLLLARSAARRREFAVCAAVGAVRWRLMRRSLMESLLLATCGGGGGLLVGVWLKAVLVRFIPDVGYELRLDTRTDENVLLFVLATTLVTTLLCGLLPALRASRPNLVRDLQNARTGGGARQRLGRILVAAQVALSLLLVAGAGLFARSLGNLRAVDPGFDPENLLLFRLNADQASYSAQQRLAFFHRVGAQLAAIPGVKGAAASDIRLLGGHMHSSGFSIPGRERRPDENMQANLLTISDTFLETLGIPLQTGRRFGPQDTSESDPVTIINEELARNHFPDQDPLGHFVKVGERAYRIVGVCGSALYTEVREGHPVTLYLSANQQIPRAMHFAVRSALPPMALVQSVRTSVATVDASIPLADISTQQAQLDRSLILERTFTTFCGALGTLAVLLCCIGLYGLMTYSIAQRTVEIGIRMALGAPPVQVVRKIFTESLAMTSWGLVIGLPVAIGLGFVARGVFYGVTPYDPVTLTGAVLCLVVATLLAAWLPSHRAAKIDPIEALRYE